MLAVQHNDAGNWAHLAVTSGTAGIAGLNLGDQQDDDKAYIRYDNNGESLLVGSNAAERMRIDSKGWVGIGTNNPRNTLHLYDPTGSGICFDAMGDVEWHIGQGSSDSFYIASGIPSTSMNMLSIDNNGNTYISHVLGDVEIGNTSSTITIKGIDEYSDNAAATSGGLTAGDLYRTGDLLKIVH